MRIDPLSLDAIKQAQAWRQRLQTRARRLYEVYLCETASVGSLPLNAVDRDRWLWVEEIFWSRACQEGLAAAIAGSSVEECLEARATGAVLEMMITQLDGLRSFAASIPGVVAASVQEDGAPQRAALEQAISEICRHLSCLVGHGRALLGQHQAIVYPTDPFVIAAMSLPPLTLLVTEQARSRLSWAGSMGVADTIGRAHWGTLSDTPRRGQTLGGKIDARLVDRPETALAVPTQLQSPKGGRGGIGQELRSRMAAMTASELVEEFILANPLVCRSYAGLTAPDGGKVWSPKSRQQFRSAALLITKHFGIKPFVQLTHDDFVSFQDRLFEMPTDHHIPLRDDERTLDEIIDRARGDATDGAYKRLAPSTVVRHLNNLRTLYAWLGSIFMMPIISWGRIIRWSQDHLRPEACHLSIAQIQEIFALPIWTGCDKHRGTPMPGKHVWHSAAYWVPLFLWYTGVARDVLCASKTSDIVLVDGLWCLRVTMEQGSVSLERGFDRDVPLHPELLRLGFIDYVEALKAGAHTMLFPELTRASGQSAADIFSSRHWRAMRLALPTLPLNLAVGAIRDSANKALEDQGAFPEKVADLFGRRGTGDTDLRYTRVTPAAHLLGVILQIPVTTEHIKRHPIRLLPDDAMVTSISRTVPRAQNRLNQDQILGRLIQQKAPDELENLAPTRDAA